MMKFLLIINGEIPNISQEGFSNYYQRILYYIDVENSNLISVDFRALTTIVNYKTQSVQLVKEKDKTLAVQNLEKKLGIDVTKNLLNGCCEIISIVNTPGGYGGYAKNIQKCLMYLRKLGALTKVYIFSTAASSGFIICSAFEKKYSLLETEFMFHRGGIPEDILFEDDDEYEEEDHGYDEEEMLMDYEMNEMSQYLDMFFANSNKEFEEECENLKKKCLNNHEGDTYYSGEHMFQLGIVTDCSDSVLDLIELFKKEIVIVPTKTGTIQALLNEMEIECNELMKNGIFRPNKLGLGSVNESPFLRR
jgi:hypothetical protein